MQFEPCIWIIDCKTYQPIKILNDRFKFLPQPVNFYEPNSKGFYDVCGNVWELTEEQFDGLPGFKTHYLYDDYSGPSCDGRHNVLMV